MPVIVVARQGPNVLLGQSGKWLIDTASNKTQFAQTQRSTAETEEDAIADLIATAPPNANIANISKKNDYYSGKFVDTTNPNPFGFIKGTYPDPKFPGETPVQAAAREFGEETFTPISEADLTFIKKNPKVNLYVYRLDVDKPKADAIIDTWTKKGLGERVGELVTLKWVPITDLPTMTLNEESQLASGGRKRTKTLRRRKLYKRTFKNVLKPTTLARKNRLNRLS